MDALICLCLQTHISHIIVVERRAKEHLFLAYIIVFSTFASIKIRTYLIC